MNTTDTLLFITSRLAEKSSTPKHSVISIEPSAAAEFLSRKPESGETEVIGELTYTAQPRVQTLEEATALQAENIMFAVGTRNGENLSKLMDIRTQPQAAFATCEFLNPDYFYVFPVKAEITQVFHSEEELAAVWEVA